MKTILILMDTLRRDVLKAYNENSNVITPNLQKFAQNATLFKQHWIGSAPCMPARRDIFTGRLNFLERSWGPMEAYDNSLVNILKENDIYTHIITDHTHYFRIGGEGYVQQFNTWQFNRGQEGDPWISQIDDPLMPSSFYGRIRRQYEINRQLWKNNPDEYPSAKTFLDGIEWMQKNKNKDNYFLMVETFDPHEPFDVDDSYMEKYKKVEMDRDYFEIPNYGQTNVPEEAVKYLETRYKALVTMTDDYFGKFIDSMDKKDFDEAMIIVTSDHGFFFGEHGYLGKNVMPMYNELSHLPLIIKFPHGKYKGQVVEDLTQAIDFMPTILDFYNIETPETVKGESIFKSLEKKKRNKDSVLFGYHGLQMNLTDGKYTYFKAPNKENKPLYEYTTSLTKIRGFLGKGYEEKVEIGHFLERTKYPVYKVPVDIPSQIASESTKLSLVQNSYLFDIEKDYAQKNNLIENNNLVNKYNRLMIKLMKYHDAPKEQFERMELNKED